MVGSTGYGDSTQCSSFPGGYLPASPVRSVLVPDGLSVDRWCRSDLQRIGYRIQRGDGLWGQRILSGGRIPHEPHLLGRMVDERDLLDDPAPDRKVGREEVPARE